MKEFGAALPQPADEAADARQVTLPTDGTRYEAELAHCSSCDPMREAQLRVETEKYRIENRRNCVEVELLGRGADSLSGRTAADSAEEPG